MMKETGFSPHWNLLLRTQCSSQSIHSAGKQVSSLQGKSPAADPVHYFLVHAVGVLGQVRAGDHSVSSTAPLPSILHSCTNKNHPGIYSKLKYQQFQIAVFILPQGTAPLSGPAQLHGQLIHNQAGEAVRRAVCQQETERNLQLRRWQRAGCRPPTRPGARSTHSCLRGTDQPQPDTTTEPASQCVKPSTG